MKNIHLTQYDKQRIEAEKKHPGKCIGCWHWQPNPFLHGRLDWSSRCCKPWGFNGGEADASLQGELHTTGGFSCAGYTAYSKGCPRKGEPE